MKSDTYKVETKKKNTIIIMGVGAMLALCVFVCAVLGLLLTRSDNGSDSTSSSPPKPPHGGVFLWEGGDCIDLEDQVAQTSNAQPVIVYWMPALDVQQLTFSGGEYTLTPTDDGIYEIKPRNALPPGTYTLQWDDPMNILKSPLETVSYSWSFVVGTGEPGAVGPGQTPEVVETPLPPNSVGSWKIDVIGRTGNIVHVVLENLGSTMEMPTRLQWQWQIVGKVADEEYTYPVRDTFDPSFVPTGYRLVGEVSMENVPEAATDRLLVVDSVRLPIPDTEGVQYPSLTDRSDLRRAGETFEAPTLWAVTPGAMSVNHLGETVIEVTVQNVGGYVQPVDSITIGLLTLEKMYAMQIDLPGSQLEPIEIGTYYFATDEFAAQGPTDVLISYDEATFAVYKLELSQTAFIRSLGAWRVSKVDVGRVPQLALDESGRPHISYSGGEEGLKYAWHDGTGWQIETVVSEGFTSLALDGSGQPHIAYSDSTDRVLKYAQHDGTGWRIETVVSHTAARYISLALDRSGQPHCLWYSNFPGDLKYAWYNGTSWQIETVASDEGGSLSLVLDGADRPHISYNKQDYYDSVLKYSWHDGTAWQIEIVEDSEEKVGWDTSLGLDESGRPHISYCGGGLKYAWHDGTGWQIEMVDSEGGCRGTSLALDGSGQPHIIYSDSTDGVLKYAQYDGTGWRIETIDSGWGEGTLVLDGSGRIHIVYVTADEQLMYAWRE